MRNVCWRRRWRCRFPDNGSTLKADTKLQYAGILMEAKHYDQAAALYSQMLTDDPGNLSAWMGLVSAHHEMGQDTQAIADVEKMPPATYEAALADPGFLSMLGAIYQQANQYEVAQGLLERSMKLQTAAGGQPSVAIELQLAGIYLLRNNTEQAYALYQQILQKDPNRADAWKGLIAALQATNRNAARRCRRLHRFPRRCASSLRPTSSLSRPRLACMRQLAIWRTQPST